MVEPRMAGPRDGRQSEEYNEKRDKNRACAVVGESAAVTQSVNPSQNEIAAMNALRPKKLPWWSRLAVGAAMVLVAGFGHAAWEYKKTRDRHIEI